MGSSHYIYVKVFLLVLFFTFLRATTELFAWYFGIMVVLKNSNFVSCYCWMGYSITEVCYVPNYL